ncbi:MAG: hypothetical protein HZC28_05475 [Spirochaetes bacterium]|nr:hypothetical protein [Spirochaetota bacterium]
MRRKYIGIVALSLLHFAASVTIGCTAQKPVKPDAVKPTADSNEIVPMRIPGPWLFYGSDVPRGQFTFSSDGTFLLHGWLSNGFRSSGSWRFDDVHGMLLLTFVDNRDFWSWQFRPSSNRFGAASGIVKLDPRSCSLMLQVKRTWRTSNLYVNFLGWNFIQSNIYSTDTVRNDIGETGQ